jgi:hypothetical protein
VMSVDGDGVAVMIVSCDGAGQGRAYAHRDNGLCRW